MKKLILTVLSFLVVIAESTLLTRFRLEGIIPNLTLIFVMTMGMVDGNRWGRNIGFFMGLAQDVLFSPFIGFYALVYFYIGHMSGYCKRVIRNSNLLVPLLLILLGDLAYGMISYLFRAFLLGQTHFFFYLRTIILPEAAYTSFFILPIFCFLRWLSRKLDGLHMKETVSSNFSDQERIQS